MFITVIIPTLNEADNILMLLAQLQSLRSCGHEVIVVDGGSVDNTISLATSLADYVLTTTPGRSSQMNAGARLAKHEILWFLHADSSLQPKIADAIIKHMSKKRVLWGRFNVRLTGHYWLFRIIERMINIRSRLTGIATGDQGIFVKKEIFFSVQGFDDLPLMEDIALSRKLKKIQRPLCLRQTLSTSSRRWEKHGVLKTIVLMWYLRLAYYLGVNPSHLHRLYK